MKNEEKNATMADTESTQGRKGRLGEGRKEKSTNDMRSCKDYAILPIS